MSRSSLPANPEAASVRPNHVAFLATLGMVGGGFLFAKGAIRATLGDDVSLVPVSLFLTGFGVWALAETVADTGQLKWVPRIGRGLAALTIASGAVAIAYLLARTIPETDGASPAVGASYGVAAASMYLGQLLLAVASVRTQALPGRLRWAPMAVVILQFPAFIVAGAIGDTVGEETITDGLGMLLAGLLWVGSSAAVWSVARHAGRADSGGVGEAESIHASSG